MQDVNFSPTPVASDASEDQAISRALLEAVAARAGADTRAGADAAHPRAIRIWAPVPALAMSRLDELRAGAAEARAIAAAAGIDAVRRVSGGHAVVVGPGSFCAGFAEPAPTFEGTQARYELLSDALIAAFGSLGIEAERGELPGEWCPGAWSIRAGNVKLAGLAQRAIKGAAWIEAVIDLAPDPGSRALLAQIYAALGLDLDPVTLGSVSELAGRPVTFRELADALLAHLRRSSDP